MRFLDMREIGNRLFTVRKKTGATQAEVAETAGISDRTYADIERGNVNMRLETFLRICRALRVTPNELLTSEDETAGRHQEELIAQLDSCPPKEKEVALRLLEVYLKTVFE